MDDEDSTDISALRSARDAKANFFCGDVDVVNTILGRRDSGSKPGARRDPHTIALVIQGGGMRGSYTAGMVDALAQWDLRDSFDRIYGTSAGAFSAVVFAGGAACGATSIYAEHLSGAQFIDFRRFLTGAGPLLDLRYLTDDVLSSKRPLNFAVLAGGGLSVCITATSLRSGRTTAFADLVTDEDWKHVMRASACVPILAGNPVAFRGAKWIDGSIREPFALHRALRDGASHVLVLHSRPRARFSWRACSARNVLRVAPFVSCGVYALTTRAERLAAASRTGATSVDLMLSVHGGIRKKLC